jgi:hypothetical protein
MRRKFTKQTVLGQVRAMRDAGPDGPVVMLNLLKFREC